MSPTSVAREALEIPELLDQIVKQLANSLDLNQFANLIVVNKLWFSVIAEHAWAECPEQAVVGLVPAAETRKLYDVCNTDGIRHSTFLTKLNVE